MTRERQRMFSTQNDAADQQPWRCVKCQKAVRKGHNDPCDCHPNLASTNEATNNGSISSDETERTTF